jgi:ankyrin repeat protein
MMASSGPYPAAVKMLLDHQADPNITEKEEHYTALMYAAAEGQLENVRILLSNGADPASKDIDGDDALTFARNNRHTDVVLLLQSLNNQ